MRKYLTKREKQRIPVAIREIKPRWCMVPQCDVIKKAQKVCKENNRPLDVMMQMMWESDMKCLACQDKKFKQTLSLLGVDFRKRGRAKKKVKK